MTNLFANYPIFLKPLISLSRTKCYLASIEKETYISVRSEDAKVSNDKVKIARKQYRGQGQYIEEILL